MKLILPPEILARDIADFAHEHGCMVVSRGIGELELVRVQPSMPSQGYLQRIKADLLRQCGRPHLRVVK